jgi:hypothetical protein
MVVTLGALLSACSGGEAADSTAGASAPPSSVAPTTVGVATTAAPSTTAEASTTQAPPLTTLPAATTSPPTTSPPTTGPAPTSPTGEFRVEASLPELAATIGRFNELGAAGWAFVGPLASSQLAATAEFGDLFVRDSLHSGRVFEYATEPAAADTATWLAAANARGLDGFLFKGPYLVGVQQVDLFVRDADGSRTYEYELLPSAPVVDGAALMAELNAQGARGYRWLGPLIVGTSFVNAYVSDVSDTTYSYEGRPGSGLLGIDDIDAFVATANEMGAAGAQYVTSMNVDGGTATLLVFETNSAPMVRSYSAVAAPLDTPLDSLVADINAQAAAGSFFWGEIVADDLSSYRLFVSTTIDLRHPLTGPWFP